MSIFEEMDKMEQDRLYHILCYGLQNLDNNHLNKFVLEVNKELRLSNQAMQEGFE